MSQTEKELFILKDLKEKAKEIEKNNFADYNQTLAYSICQGFILANTSPSIVSNH